MQLGNSKIMYGQETGQPPDCKVCSTIVGFFQSPDQPMCVLGTLPQLMNSQCETHSSLFTQIYASNDMETRDLGSNVGLALRWDSLDKNMFIPKTYGDDRNSPRTVSISWGQSHYLSIEPAANLPDVAPRTRSVDADWIDISLLKKFKEDCECYHRCSDEARYTDFTTKPQYLIDVVDRCIVPFSPGAKYAALSYVWGGVTALLTTKGNIAKLSTPGELGGLASLKSIPPTVLHAMELTKALGETHLWCDALCIVQDDENRHMELANMASIYANASFTIVAANGENANHGLPGLKGISEPRPRKATLWPLGKSLGLELVPGIGSRPETSTTRFWSSRAWTLQEHLLSHKLLIFHDNTASWSCGRGSYFEHMTWPNEEMRGGPSTRCPPVAREAIDLSNRIPSIFSLLQLISRFNILALTYPEDVLDAFSGLMAGFGKSWGEFVSGLPTIFFNLALLWEMSGDVEPRIPRNRAKSTCLPSWSWAGWEGNIIHHDCWARVGGQVYGMAIGGTKANSRSVLVWQSHQTRDGQGTTIDFRWSSFQDRFINKASHPVPSGWARYSADDLLKHLDFCQNCNIVVQPNRAHHIPVHLHSFPRCDAHDHSQDWYRNPQPGGRFFLQVSYIYVHSSQPGKPFAFPVPIPEDTYVPAIEYAPFISCTTRRAWFQAGGSNLRNSKSPFDRDGHHYLIEVLHEFSNDFVGCLNPQADIQPGDRIELIELAECQFGSERDVWRYEYPEMGPTGNYDFYYVMCIRWEDGIAYRQGVGRIRKDAWLEVQKEEIYVMLG